MDFAAARRKMVASQVRTNKVTDSLVSGAMEQVPREYFVPAERRSVAYLDEDQPVGNGRFIMEPMALGRVCAGGSFRRVGRQASRLRSHSAGPCAICRRQTSPPLKASRRRHRP